VLLKEAFDINQCVGVVLGVDLDDLDAHLLGFACAAFSADYRRSRFIVGDADGQGFDASTASAATSW
jgi:hypothetical protein